MFVEDEDIKEIVVLVCSVLQIIGTIFIVGYMLEWFPNRSLFVRIFIAVCGLAAIVKLFIMDFRHDMIIPAICGFGIILLAIAG